MALFSKRYQQALIAKQLNLPTIPDRARMRVWMTMQRLSETLGGRDDGWDWWTDHLQHGKRRITLTHMRDRVVRLG